MDLIKTIGKVARNGYIVEIINILSKEHDKLKAELHQTPSLSIPAIFDIETAIKWENWLELSYVKKLRLEERRARIIAKILSNTSCTPQFLRNLAKSITGGTVKIEEQFDKYHFVISFTDIIGEPPNIKAFIEAVNINKPAHLTFSIKYKYRKWRDLEPYKWKDLENTSWVDIYEKESE